MEKITKKIHVVTIGYKSEHALVSIKEDDAKEVVILYMLDPLRKEESEKVKKTVEQTAHLLSQLGYVTYKKEIKKWNDIIELFNKKYKNYELTINLTGALKWLAIMLYIYALSNPKRVDKIYFVKFLEGWELTELPKQILPYSLTKLEKSILNAKSNTLEELEKELKKPKSTLVKYLKELTKKNLIKYEKGTIKRRYFIITKENPNIKL